MLNWPIKGMTQFLKLGYTLQDWQSQEHWKDISFSLRVNGGAKLTQKQTCICNLQLMPQRKDMQEIKSHAKGMQSDKYKHTVSIYKMSRFKPLAAHHLHQYPRNSRSIHLHALLSSECLRALWHTLTSKTTVTWGKTFIRVMIIRDQLCLLDFRNPNERGSLPVKRSPWRLLKIQEELPHPNNKLYSTIHAVGLHQNEDNSSHSLQLNCNVINCTYKMKKAFVFKQK